MTRKLVIGLAAGFLIVSVAALDLPVASANSCVTLSDGTVACGSATPNVVNNTAVCSGTATASVSWSCAADTLSPTCHAETDQTGLTFDGTSPKTCNPAGCTRATLYANGVIVDQSLYNC
jgi:hypothetical protein